MIDHTPGYGSVARYWMHMVQNANEENAGSSPADPVLVLQAMGRKIGFIPAAARLADPAREMPLQIYLAESPCSLEQLADQVNDQLRRSGRCIVVVSEGFDVGDVGRMQDAFGHTAFGSSKLTVVQIVVNYLNEVGLGGQRRRARQRARHRSAALDGLCLAGRSGRGLLPGADGPQLAAKGQSGYMATILRNPGCVYSVRYDKVSLAEVANSERTFPAAWIARQRLRRDRRFHPLRPAAGGQRHDQPADRRRAAAADPLQADLCREEAAGLCAAGGSEVMIDLTPTTPFSSASILTAASSTPWR